jgi:ABC-2 type transport system permease protein
MSTRDDTRREGVIHDIGYQHYEGARLGRWYSIRSLYVHSVRTAFGLGRGAKSKILPIGLLAIASLASLIIVVISSQLPERVLSYVGIASTFSFGATVFVAVTGPELVSRDLRDKVLSLYFCRPVSRIEYALTKLAALTSSVFILFGTPMLIMVVGMSFSTDDGFQGVLNEVGDFAVGLSAAAIHAIVFSALALPLASLTGRRVFATGMIVGLFLLSAPVSGMVRSLGSQTAYHVGGILDPVSLVNGIDTWLYDEGLVDVGGYGAFYGVVALALVLAGTALLTWRYRKVKA